jgi:threonine synthase
VTLGAGWTPISPARIDGHDVSVKEEHLNPTGSFKDRGVAVLANLASGVEGPVFVDSVGNTGLALATFAEALTIEAHVFAPLTTSTERETAITHHGARFHRVAGPRSEAGKVAMAVAEDGVCFLSHIYQPLFQAGTASAAFEIFEQTPSLPDRIFLAVGQGSLFLGLLNGFKALATAGEITNLPALFAARPAIPLGTIAVGASAAHPVRAQDVRLAAAATGGDVIRISEGELRDANAALEEAGFVVDPTSALGVAAWRKIVEATGPSADLIILTGARREAVPPTHSADGESA